MRSRFSAAFEHFHMPVSRTIMWRRFPDQTPIYTISIRYSTPRQHHSRTMNERTHNQIPRDRPQENDSSTSDRPDGPDVLVQRQPYQIYQSQMRCNEFIGCTFQPSRDPERGCGLIIRSGDDPWASQYLRGAASQLQRRKFRTRTV